MARCMGTNCEKASQCKRWLYNKTDETVEDVFDFSTFGSGSCTVREDNKIEIVSQTKCGKEGNFKLFEDIDNFEGIEFNEEEMHSTAFLLMKPVARMSCSVESHVPLAKRLCVKGIRSVHYAALDILKELKKEMVWDDGDGVTGLFIGVSELIDVFEKFGISRDEFMKLWGDK